MSCNIIRENGQITVVTDQNTPSLLFQELRENFTQEQALEIYKSSKSEAFETVNKAKNALLYSVNQNDVKLSRQINGNSISYIPTIKGKRIGTLRIKGDRVDMITIYDAFKGKGYGKSLYKQVAKDLSQRGIQLKSDNASSQDDLNVWESLVRDNLAEQTPDGRYQFLLQNSYPNGEPSMQSVLEFLRNQNRTQRELNTEERIELKNLSLGFQGDLKAEMNKVFYDQEGFFTVVPQKMQSLYSQYEIDRILKSPSLQNQIKESLEAFQNTEFDLVTEQEIPQEQLIKSGTIGKFGKVLYENPNRLKQDLMEEIAGVGEDMFEENTFITLQEAQSFVKARVLADVDGTIVEPNLGDRLAISAVLPENPYKAISAIVKITNISDEILLESPQETYRALSNIENEALKMGIDVIGIKDQADNPSLKPFLNALGGVMENPIEENLATFSKLYPEFFPSQIQETKAIRQPNDRDYVYLQTALSEGEVFNQIRAIKKSENIYVQVNDKTLEELYEIAPTYIKESNTEVDKLYSLAKNSANFDSFYDKAIFRDAHSAPSKDTTPTEEKIELGGDFSLREVAQGFHNQPEDYFSKDGARYYGYNDNQGMQSYTAISNVIRGLSAGRDSIMITTYRTVPLSVEVNDLKDYDWVSFSESYANNHGESRFGENQYKLIKQEVSIDNLWWDGNDIREWGFDTGNTKSYSRRELQDVWEKRNSYNLRQASNFTREQNQREALQIESPNRETAEKINLFKIIFGLENTQSQPQLEPITFTGNYEYLTSDFVAEFNIKSLREKKKNSPMWLNFYSNFEINEQGINLKYTDDLTLSIVEELADENLRQYSLISKQMPNLAQTTLDENPDISQKERDFYVNNPQMAPLMQSPTIVDSETLISDSQERFTKRQDGSLWENVFTQNGKSLFKRQMVNKSQYNTFGNPKPQFNGYDFDLKASMMDNSNVKDSTKAKNILKESFDC